MKVQVTWWSKGLAFYAIPHVWNWPEVGQMNITWLGKISIQINYKPKEEA